MSEMLGEDEDEEETEEAVAPAPKRAEDKKDISGQRS